MDLCIYFEVGFDYYFALEIASLCQLLVLVVEGELVQVVADHELRLADSFQQL